jgi:hypothetical protein
VAAAAAARPRATRTYVHVVDVLVCRRPPPSVPRVPPPPLGLPSHEVAARLGMVPVLRPLLGTRRLNLDLLAARRTLASTLAATPEPAPLSVGDRNQARRRKRRTILSSSGSDDDDDDDEDYVDEDGEATHAGGRGASGRHGTRGHPPSSVAWWAVQRGGRVPVLLPRQLSWIRDHLSPAALR